SLRGVLSENGQRQAECRTRTGGADDRQLTAMSFHRCFADRKSHAHAAVLCRKEGLEQVRNVLRRDARTGILDGYSEAAVLGMAGAHRESARSVLFRHGLTGIDHEIDEDLLKLNTIASNQGQLRLGLDGKDDIVLR